MGESSRLPIVGLGIKAVESAYRAQPERSFRILVDGDYNVVTQAMGVLRLVLIVGKARSFLGPRFRVQSLEPATPGPDP